MDLKAKVDYCSDYQLHELFRRFYLPASPPSAPSTPSAPAAAATVDTADSAHVAHATLVKECAQRFVRVVRQSQRPISPAQVQGHLLLHKQDPALAVRAAAAPSAFAAD